MPTVDQAQKEFQANQQAMAQLQQQINGLLNYRAPGGMVNETTARNASSAHQQAFALTNQLNAMQAKSQALQQGVADARTQAGNDDAKAKAEANQKQITGTAQGGIDRLKGDQTDQMFRDYLQKQMGAQPLDPNATPFKDGAPQYNAQGMTAQQGQASTYDPTNTKAFNYDPNSVGSANMQAQSVNYQDPFDEATIGAMVNEQAGAAGAAESARNQLMRDSILANGGNAFDPSLQASQAESMGERNRAVASARNQINMVANRENAATRNAASMANAGFGQQAAQTNAGFQQQANMANQNAQNQAGQFNANASQSAAGQNAQFANQAGQFNANAIQSAGFQNAQLGQQAGQFNANAQNQAGQFNVGNQMNATNANFGAQRQAQQFNQGVQSQAAGQLGTYNNQRQGMISDAEGRLINVLGQQVFRGPEASTAQPSIQYPSFQQYSTQTQQARPQQQPSRGFVGTYQNPSIQAGLTSPVWAGSGKPSVSSGYTTSSFGPGQIGNPYGAGAMVGTGQPAVNKPAASGFVQKPGSGLAPQFKKPVGPYDNY